MYSAMSPENHCMHQKVVTLRGCGILSIKVHMGQNQKSQLNIQRAFLSLKVLKPEYTDGSWRC